jgi:hypothetical protein
MYCVFCGKLNTESYLTCQSFRKISGVETFTHLPRRFHFMQPYRNIGLLSSYVLVVNIYNSEIRSFSGTRLCLVLVLNY